MQSERSVMLAVMLSELAAVVRERTSLRGSAFAQGYMGFTASHKRETRVHTFDSEKRVVAQKVLRLFRPFGLKSSHIGRTQLLFKQLCELEIERDRLMKITYLLGVGRAFKDSANTAAMRRSVPAPPLTDLPDEIIVMLFHRADMIGVMSMPKTCSRILGIVRHMSFFDRAMVFTNTSFHERFPILEQEKRIAMNILGLPKCLPVPDKQLDFIAACHRWRNLRVQFQECFKLLACAIRAHYKRCVAYCNAPTSRSDLHEIAMNLAKTKMTVNEVVGRLQRLCRCTPLEKMPFFDQPYRSYNYREWLHNLEPKCENLIYNNQTCLEMCRMDHMYGGQVCRVHPREGEQPPASGCQFLPRDVTGYDAFYREAWALML